MKTLGIIAEFNPFHDGHKYLLDNAKEQTGAECAVAVMSGSFVQRGEPAAFDKWSRAEEAVKQGINLVVELPQVFACASAEYFAKGGVKVLEGLGCVDYLAFGSESGDLDKLKIAAELLSSREEELHRRIRDIVKEGTSYPAARAKAARELWPDFDAGILDEPNNILAIEYLKQTKTMEPFTIKRKGQGHHISASKLRMEMREADPAGFDRREEVYWRLLCGCIMRASEEELEGILSAGGGLGLKLKQEIRYASSTEELVERLKSKAYTYTRICRLLAQTLLGIDEAAVSGATVYIRILAMDEKGRALLNQIKKNESNALPVITNLNKGLKDYPQIEKTVGFDILAADLHNLIFGRDLYAMSDYVHPIFIKENE